MPRALGAHFDAILIVHIPLQPVQVICGLGRECQALVCILQDAHCSLWLALAGMLPQRALAVAKSAV